MELVGGGSVINRAYQIYFFCQYFIKRGLKFFAAVQDVLKASLVNVIISHTFVILNWASTVLNI